MGRPIGSKNKERPPEYKADIPSSNMPADLKYYTSQKVKMLVQQFYINLTKEELEHFWELTNEEQVDRYARRLLLKYL